MHIKGSPSRERRRNRRSSGGEGYLGRLTGSSFNESVWRRLHIASNQKKWATQLARRIFFLMTHLDCLTVAILAVQNRQMFMEGAELFSVRRRL
jgi:hypothetical protein